LIFGAGAFATLLPSAPGYLGSLQAAFVLSFSALGIPPDVAILLATAAQLLLFGSVTVAGLGILSVNHVSAVSTLSSAR
jgi:uncharacterized membrane protein YbhN (UPF0104 family)